MGPASHAAASPSQYSPAASSKRRRVPEDEVYVDNLNSHKRYLSEIMASSLNGLTVEEDPLPDNLMDSTIMKPYLRDETSVQYSSLSEDSDDSRYYESSTNTCSSQPESAPTSPVSPYRCQNPLSGFMSGPNHGPVVPSSASPQPRQHGSDTEGCFPSSPNDICHSADLRLAALLRSVQLRTQPLVWSQFEMQLSPGQECGSNVDVGERWCSYLKLDDERRYPLAVSEGDERKMPCRTLSVDMKEDETNHA